MREGKRIIAAILAAVFTVLQVAEVMPMSQVEAASTVDVGSVNLLEHSDFEETDIELIPHSAGTKLGNWSNYPDTTTAKKVQHDAHTGEWAVELSGSLAAIEQDSDDLQVGVTYVAKVWAKVTNPSTTTAWFGVKNYGGDQIKVQITSTEYQQYEIPFTYTGSSYARVFVWVESMSGGAVYADDFEMMTDSDLEQVSIENGKITVTYREDYTGTPSRDDYSVVYTSSLNSTEEKELVITGAKVKGNQLELSFDSIAQEPLEQLITADVTYIPKNQTLTLDYAVEANGEELVVAGVKSFTAENGIATVVLDKTPTVAPVQNDFALEKSLNGGAYEAISITGFSYDAATKTVTLQFPVTNKKADKQEVALKLTYNGQEKTAEFDVEIGNGTTYYVDATEGNDNNSGTSPEQAFKTIDKVNSIVFQPGDQILFQCGEEWTGALKPQGSGVEGEPIVISSYGEGAKPLLKPGANWTIPYFNVASKVIYNPTVNNVITFYNQEYWEVCNLELYDPTYSSNASTSVYRRGVNISAEDVGDLYHFVFDNLTIHGFRGPNSNEGKSSGGIIMTIYSDPYNSANRVPTAVHDITVTNCEMYDLGRSGFNFVTPWTTRTGDEWGSFSYTGYGEWKPYENVTISNNVIYNIDGDGVLIDNCKNALIEHNVVYRAVLNCWYGVGMFNWNSDDTVFQFNEIYETFPADSLLGAGDGQGIEIDAINRDTLVQYNYIHDNTGGCIMWCSTDTLRTIRGTYRYNIFQNDLTKHGVIDWRTNHKESMAYNNVFYFGELPEGSDQRVFMNNGYMNGKSEAKFYNNIFYNLDEFNLNTFNEQEIDWEGNIFYGFDEVPANDSTIITQDPKFVNPGSGTYGIDSVEGYKLQADSPAIDAGINIEDNGGRDYFGTPLTDGKTDIGAAEYTEETVDPPVEEENEVIRIAGAGRIDTALEVADTLKETLGLEKFETVIIATSKTFADALPGSYLAYVENAPILLISDARMDDVVAYVKANLKDDGKVYILGGEAAVSASLEGKLDGYAVDRLAGAGRYETNMMILERAGVTGGEIIVATGKTFADSLSASAAKLPILMVKDALNADQKAMLATMNVEKFYIVGGESAVGAKVAEELAAYASVERVAGANRRETSIAVAKKFFENPDMAVVASASNFPDGLCGGPLAAALNAPLVLTVDGKTTEAAAYTAELGIEAGYVLGGTGVLTDDSVVDVFALESAADIITK